MADLPEARLVPMGSLAKTPEAQAAAAVADAGGSPRAQIDAARAARKARGVAKKAARIGYTSHQGKRQRERALARMAKATSPAESGTLATEPENSHSP